MKRLAVTITLGLLAGALGLAHADASPSGTLSGTISGTIQPYMSWTSTNTTMRISLGLPGYTSTVTNPYIISPEATMEGVSNQYVQLDYENMGPMTTTWSNGVISGSSILETVFYKKVLGKVLWDGAELGEEDVWGLPETEATDKSGRVIFSPGVAAGIHMGIQVKRKGLQDHSGLYKTQINLTWSNF